MPNQDLLSFKDGKFGPDLAVVKQASARVPKAKKMDQRGCDHCPRNGAVGIKKIKNLVNVKGRRVMIWSQNPDGEENREGRAFVGAPAMFFWKHANSVGLMREDCDVQTVVRCWTADRDDYDAMVSREPNKEEIQACSLYTEEAIQLNGGKARVHLVLGNVAAKALLGREFRKDQKTFYSQNLKAWVICTNHPAYLLRGVSDVKMEEFIECLAAVAKKAEQEVGQYTYINKQDYRACKASEMGVEIESPVKAHKGRVVVDIEDDVDENGNVVLVYVGFAWKKGHSRGVFIDHPKVRQSKAARDAKFAMVKRILEDPDIIKAAHHGSHETDNLLALGIRFRGYDFDTEYSEYHRFPGEKAFGLEAIADRRFREFAGYKAMLDQYKNPETDLYSMREIPPSTIVTYNGVDCDLTKRIELSNASRTKGPIRKLMEVYIWAGRMLARMEKLGPLFDYEYDNNKLEKWIPIRITKLRKAICDIAENPDLNPQSPAQLKNVLYGKLKLGRFLDDSWKEKFPNSTNAETLALLKEYHPIADLIVEFRGMTKIQSTYRAAFRESAERHGGRVTTKWWLTGAITGRLRSGGEKNVPKKKKRGIVNLQNIHGDPAVECMLVSDLAWRDVVKDWQRNRNAQATGAGKGVL